MIAVLQSTITIAILLTLTVLAEAGYVDLYEHAYFKKKLMRIDVVLDICYTLKCGYLNKPDTALNDKVTSAKWHGLREKSDLYPRGDAVITFYKDPTCKGDRKSWEIKTQSRDDMYFPENFRLDEMNDAISSFRVVNAGGNYGMEYACPPSKEVAVTNATVSEGAW